MKKHRRKKKVAPKRKSRRRQGGPDPKRLTRSGVARILGISATTVIHYMAQDGAPEPDGHNRYEPAAAIKWCKEHSQWAIGGIDPAAKTLKAEKLELEIAELRRQDGLRKGELFERKEWDDEATAFVTDVEGTYRKLLFHELPSKLVGKSEPEVRELIDRYLLEAATQIRDSAVRVEKKLTHQKAS